MDLFWGDGCGTVIDPDGYGWMVGTNKAEPTAKEMNKRMEGDDVQQPAVAAALIDERLTRKVLAALEYLPVRENC